MQGGFSSAPQHISGRLTRLLANQAEHGGVPRLDAQGYKESPNKTLEEELTFIRTRIESYQSHYSRNDNPDHQYLSTDLSISKMHYLYKVKCEAEERRAFSDWVYRKVFNEEYNLSFGRPKSDTCKTCNSMKVRLEAETLPEVQCQLQSERLLHQRKPECTYHQLQEDSTRSQNDSDTLTITFDLQQSLPTPLLTVNVVYYKRQLWTFNLGVHCCRTGVGHMHMWDEKEGSRGSQEIGSCVLTFLRENPLQAKHLIAYSDSCGGQNRNINIVCLWQYVVCNDDFSYTTTDHRFMISGHSYLPNNHDFGGIEGARRRQSSFYYVPEQWGELLRKAAE